MFESLKRIIKESANSESININISQSEIQINGKKIEGEAGAKIIHGIKDLFVEADKVFDKVDEAMDGVDKLFDKMEKAIKTEKEKK